MIGLSKNRRGLLFVHQCISCFVILGLQHARKWGVCTVNSVKTLPSLASLDSAFQLQEYISLLIRLDVHDVNSIVSLPGNLGCMSSWGQCPVFYVFWNYGWKPIFSRRLVQDLSYPLITTLQQECTRASCPEMKVGEWLHLCVAHGIDGAMKVCFFHITLTIWTWLLVFPWKASLRYRLHFTPSTVLLPC